MLIEQIWPVAKGELSKDFYNQPYQDCQANVTHLLRNPKSKAMPAMDQTFIGTAESSVEAYGWCTVDGLKLGCQLTKQ